MDKLDISTDNYRSSQYKIGANFYTVKIYYLKRLIFNKLKKLQSGEYYEKK
ncbi:MAG: hypothetical protein PHP92_05080 [Candidatus Nanoarchaeia archaeon]|nr:hypothetical protein [Candidatus Nanoarchaeia archaeon]